jgi:RNA polymerase sigma-70 factor (ECF subfamily)
VQAVAIESEPTRFDERFEECFRVSYQAAYRVLGNRADAEDIAQEAMARAYVKWRSISTYAEPWLARVATNLALDAARAKARQRTRTITPSPDTEAIAQRLDFANAIARLPRRQREVVALRYIADLSEEDVARLLKCTAGTVKQHAHRGLTALRTSGHLQEDIT